MKGIGGAGKVAIKISELLAGNENKIYVLPWWSERPTLHKANLILNDVEYIRRRISLQLLKNIIKFSIKLSFKTTLNYAIGSSKIKYSLLCLFDRAHIELIMEQLKIDLIHIHGTSLIYLPYIDAAIEKGIPLVCTSHGSSPTGPEIHMDYNENYERYVLEKISKAKQTAITAVSTSLKMKIINAYDISAKKVIVILNGIDPGRFDCCLLDKNEVRKRFHIPNGKNVVFQVGTLSKRKNHIAVLRALVEINKETDALFYAVAGDGSERENLIRFCQDNEIMNCSFFGWVMETELVQLFLSSDFFILPSQSEGSPLVFLEAMAAGLPIITFEDLEGVSDLYNGHNMELISERDTRSIILAMKRAIGRDWDRYRIKKNSRSFSWDNACKEYYKLFKQINSAIEK